MPYVMLLAVGAAGDALLELLQVQHPAARAAKIV
jgi:hypothetical protein